ncbi:MAG TPA: hypothetical protein VGP33_14295 [Chloroflexota bacterium]|jgi:hypothetical protein|nr:hypothetical protein [Chloroflexota bacterium]
MLQPPAIIISVALASVYALGYALVIGKTGNRLWWYWAFAVAGFFLGFIIAAHEHLGTIALGQIPLEESTLASLAMLILATVLRR